FKTPTSLSLKPTHAREKQHEKHALSCLGSGEFDHPCHAVTQARRLTIQLKRGGGCRRLADLGQISVRITHIAAHFILVHFRFRYEFCATRTPELVTLFDVYHAQIKKRAQGIEILWRRRDNLRLVVGSAAPFVDNYPNVLKTEKCRFAFTQHSCAKNITIKRYRASDVGDNQGCRHDEFRFRICCFHTSVSALTNNSVTIFI